MDPIETAKQRAIGGMDMFLRNFAHVPDDKLNWKPTPTAKSALRVAAHTALYAGRFAKMIKDRQLPRPDNIEEWVAKNNAEESAIVDRNEIERVFREGTAAVIEAVDSLTPEELDSVLDSGQGFKMEMRQLINLPGWHATLHLGQIDYLQTCYGDQEIYLS